MWIIIAWGDALVMPCNRCGADLVLVDVLSSGGKKGAGEGNEGRREEEDVFSQLLQGDNHAYIHQYSFWIHIPFSPSTISNQDIHNMLPYVVMQYWLIWSNRSQKLDVYIRSRTIIICHYA